MVKVHTDAGLAGLGEVVSCSYVGRAVIEAPRSAPFRHGIAAIIKNMNVTDIEAVWKSMKEGTRWYGPGGVARHTMSGIDMALWDLCGKRAGKPVRMLLNQGAVDTVPCYASELWPARPELVSESASAFLEQGYKAVKYGWAPMGPDPELDEALVAAAREALGPNNELMVDAGRVWDAQTALERVERFHQYDIFWLEEPLAPYDISGYKEVSGKSSIPIAAGELMALTEEFEDLLKIGQVPIVQPDLGRVGGITGVERIKAVARNTGARVVPHAYGTGVLLAATTQWAAANSRPLTEYTRSLSPLARDLVHHNMVFKEGSLHLDDTPGLGIELDEKVLEKYRVKQCA